MSRPKSLEGAIGSLGPHCPKCNHERSSVIDRRQGSIRRRVCAGCDHRFTTYEVAWPGLPRKAAQRLHKVKDLINEILNGDFE
jgi:transcriptional regulator NrdR family protein